MIKDRNQPIRILHVVGGMDRGGVETWLMHVLRHVDRSSFQLDFLVHTDLPGAYDHEILSLGSKILPCLHPSRPWLYTLNFKRILKQHGPYEVVHSHVHLYSGFILRLAHQLGIPVRIAHSHNDTTLMQSQAGYLRSFYQTLMRRWLQRYATAGLACSQAAAAALFGPDWQRDRRWQILHYGIDLSLFKNPVDRTRVRAELGLSPENFVVGHVGRFVAQKNHIFLIEIAQEIAKLLNNFRLFLVGDGPLRSLVEKRVTEVGLSDKVIFSGIRSDVPRLMLEAFDLFLFPSRFEGLGLVLIEAQAAGLPCLFSEVIPKEVEVVRPLLRRFSLSQPASAWAKEVLAMKNFEPSLSREESLAIIEQSDFNIMHSARLLENFYRHCAR